MNACARLVVSRNICYLPHPLSYVQYVNHYYTSFRTLSSLCRTWGCRYGPTLATPSQLLTSGLASWRADAKRMLLLRNHQTRHTSPQIFSSYCITSPGVLLNPVKTKKLDKPVMAFLSSASAHNESKSVALSRLMSPDDANLAGNVHGGTILKMIEEAGLIISTKFCNTQGSQEEGHHEDSVCALARVEKTDFLQPMYIGEVAQLVAEIVYTSPRSLLVEVTVMAEDIIKGTKRMTNRARLWYVPLSIHDSDKVTAVPPMTYSDPTQQEKGHQDYLRQKSERQRNNIDRKTITLKPQEDADPHTVAYSQSTLIHLVGPSEVTFSGHLKGGVILKMMDECAGMVAAKHCKTSIVTASLDATNFHKKVPKGGLVTLLGQAVFTSSKSIEIEVVVDVEVPWGAHTLARQRAVDAFFTFVSLDSDGKTQPVPPLKVISDDEKERWEAGLQRYNYRKQLRQAATKS